MKPALAIGVLVAVLIASAGFAGSSDRQVAHANGCEGPATHSWSGSVISYGIRDFTVSFCGPESLDAYAGAHWRGNKTLSVVLIEPDGTIHSFSGTGDVGGELEGPLASGDWTLLVRNLGPSKVRFDAELSFE